MNLSDDDVQRIVDALSAKIGPNAAADAAAAAAHKAVQELTVKGLAFVGVDVADKRQIEQFKADLGFLRSFRQNTERMGRTIGTAVTNAVTYGIVILVVIGFLFWARNGIMPQTSSAPPSLTK